MSDEDLHMFLRHSFDEDRGAQWRQETIQKIRKQMRELERPSKLTQSDLAEVDALADFEESRA